VTRSVLIIGGSGAVGARILDLLSRVPGIELLIVGRNTARTTQFADELQERNLAVRAVELDAIATHRPAVVIDASGPFRGRDQSVPRRCIEARVPYLDIADDRRFVLGIRGLDSAALAAGIPVLSGAGLLPCLTMAAVEVAAGDLDTVKSVRIWFCPGNQQSHGSAAFEGMLAAAGRPFKWWHEGRWEETLAWQNLERVEFPGLGTRLLAPWETPDLDLLPERWPELEEAVVLAGTELGFLQKGLSTFAWLPRMGAETLYRKLGPTAEGVARSFGQFGSADLGLRVSVRGSRRKTPMQRNWMLTARNGDGRFVPAAPAAALARQLLNCVPPPGARVARLGVHDILAELRGRDVEVRMTETERAFA
jgi:hypothetical protein